MVTGVRRAARLLGTALGLAALISMAGLAAAQAPWTAPAGEKEEMTEALPTEAAPEAPRAVLRRRGSR